MSLSRGHKLLLTIGGVAIIGGIGFTINAHSQAGHTKQSQVINLSAGSEIMSLDPAKMTDSTSNSQLTQVDEGLYRLNSQSKPVNALATKTTVTNNGHTYTINLRHDARWSNGHKVTAHDFVYSWRRTLDPKTKSEFTYVFTNIKNADAIAAGKKQPSTLGVKANGNYQLTITLSKPVAYFKKILAVSTFYPVNQNAVQKYGQKYGTSAAKTVYNGPFTLTGWTGTNNTWTLKKNPTYYDHKLVRLHQINYQVIKSNTTAYNLYQSNKLDTVTLSGEQSVQNKTNSELKTLAGGRIGFIQYNQHDHVAANQKLRTALSLAINRNQLTHKVLANGSIPAKSFGVRNMAKNPKTGADFVDDATVNGTVSYDLAKARTTYRQAQQQLHQKQLTLSITCGDDDASHQIAEFIQGQLTSHLPGLKVNIKAMPFTAMLGKVSKGDYQLNLTSWAMDFADPSQSLTILTSDSNSNMGHYQSKSYDRAMQAAEGIDALNATKRYQDLVQAGKIALNDQAVTPLYEGRSSILVKSHLQGVVYNNFSGAANYRTAYVK
ncbi:peptide ABC transporter substrate-binding protein [Lactiplantibacillus pentosus]|uniref:Peptide ABC transporter substrate-binding protein n=1 Tax=Lactiplantibacillus pentosus TaxID=1589 RepID=A0AB37RDY3_LACPE|nr:peptide ABC transporter substrate-binding protein [Lactiplantibacillus pentosus]RMW42523.1 peptide ABC transporter substrate-binding protein [Lactiplantibacillus pentosus]RMW48306.1 peptide ABC transporter substrate-binding protein [Lactiplantibacillus pentosus]RMW52444.1 peptide ABC transporter substrate-binding protein [Lactiplantibacillus pentosus]RMW55178.1 peptide ABC transporter substrate-binding protein [Lactiplantibacillus pentosus]